MRLRNRDYARRSMGGLVGGPTRTGMIRTPRFWGLPVRSELPQFTPEGRSVDPERAGGARSIAAVLLQRG